MSMPVWNPYTNQDAHHTLPQANAVSQQPPAVVGGQVSAPQGHTTHAPGPHASSSHVSAYNSTQATAPEVSESQSSAHQGSLTSIFASLSGETSNTTTAAEIINQMGTPELQAQQTQTLSTPQQGIAGNLYTHHLSNQYLDILARAGIDYNPESLIAQLRPTPTQLPSQYGPYLLPNQIQVQARTNQPVIRSLQELTNRFMLFQGNSSGWHAASRRFPWHYQYLDSDITIVPESFPYYGSEESRASATANFLFVSDEVMDVLRWVSRH